MGQSEIWADEKNALQQSMAYSGFPELWVEMQRQVGSIELRPGIKEFDAIWFRG